VSFHRLGPRTCASLSRVYQDIIRSFTRLAAEQPESVLFRFLKSGEGEPAVYTRRALDSTAKAIAAGLENRGMRGQRVLVALPPGLEYVSAMLGCFYAGAVPVPAPPPLSKAEFPRIRGIIEDCEAHAAIVNPGRGDALAAFGDFRLLDVDALLATDAEGVGPVQTDADELAYLQYTSGATGTPKGVRVTHGNLADNCWQISGLMNHEPYSSVVWLPPYHDMGLIGGVMMAMFTGCPMTLMPPLSFLQRPIRWLEAISKLRATSSAAPDFAFRLCIERIAPQDRERLDLSSWTHAFCGAEPIRMKTFDAFHQAFAPHGFRRETFLPSYGLAEATLMVTGKPHGVAPRSVTVDSQVLISCGKATGTTEVRVVDPEKLTPLPDGQAGEIWLRGRGVSPGYWREAGEGSPFAQSLGSEQGFLRSGDIGFLQEGELFVSGRIKNILVIRGKNFHCEDLENSAASGHALLTAQGCAALALDDGDAETLAILAEVDPRPLAGQGDDVIAGIRAAISDKHGIAVTEILVVRRGNLARTTSGKLRRSVCRQLRADGKLNVLARWPSS
jgi:acyl-CoA synthetase (AMP-forming)/AMP-acid ligase II